MSDLARRVRKVSRCLGIEVTLDLGPPQPTVEADDREQSGWKFIQMLGTPSQYEEKLKEFHEKVYRSRGRAVFHQQHGLCAICLKPMKGTENTEIDHISSRGAHGRNDHISNLRVVHGEPCHRERHTKSKGV